jgi:hypothetical protein
MLLNTNQDLLPTQQKKIKTKVIRQYITLYQGRNVKKNYLHDLQYFHKKTHGFCGRHVSKLVPTASVITNLTIFSRAGMD